MSTINDATSIIIVSLSGGKDSVACLLWALEHPPDKPLICHHQAMPEDWPQTIPYIRSLCDRLGVRLVVQQAVYRRDRADGRRRMYVLDLEGDQPLTQADLGGAAICGMLDFAYDQHWPPTQSKRWCTSYFKEELYNRWVRANRGKAVRQLSLLGDDSSDGLLGANPVTLLGFRRAESPRRARLPAARERTAVRLKLGNRDWPDGWRMLDLHPIIEWSRRQTFRYLRDHGVEPHPAYALQGMTGREMYDVDDEGGPRCSCRNCIFAHPAHLVAAARLPENHEVFARTRDFEADTGKTWQQGRSITDLLQTHEMEEQC